MTIIANVVIVAAILGYACWMVVRHVRRSKEGKCAACAVKKSCESGSCAPQPPNSK
jgi:hypothetical protein